MFQIRILLSAGLNLGAITVIWNILTLED